MRQLLDFVLGRRLAELTRGRSEAEARAFRITRNVQIIMTVLPTLIMPNVLFVEPPETHPFSFSLYGLLLTLMAISRVLLLRGRLLASASLTLVNLNIHLTGLCVAYADDPAYLGYLVLAILPFLMFPPGHRLARWLHVAAPSVAFLVYQYHYRVMGGAGLFGPPRWTGSAEYFMPPLVMMVGFLLVVVYQFVKAVDVAEARLLLEYEKTDALLVNVLPRPIVERLKASPGTIADDIGEVSVVFSDIVGFTPLSERLGAQRMVELLDALFLEFDVAAARLQVEKIETTGDGYLAAAGAPTPLPGHARAAAELALAMVEAARKTKVSDNESIEIRVGIHTGPIMAGVIGKSRFHYKIFGSTVNVASRVQGAAETGQVFVSDTTFAQLRDSCELEERGVFELKGYGPMQLRRLVSMDRRARDAAVGDRVA